MNYRELLELNYFGNSLQSYLISLSLLLTGFVFHSLLSGMLVRLISQMFKRTEYRLELKEYRQILQKSLNFFLFLIFIFLGTNHLEFPKELDLAPVEKFGLKLFILRSYQVLLAVSLTRVAIKLIVIFGEILKKRAATTESKQDDQLIPFVIEVAKIILIVISVILVVGTIFELNVGSLVAGLGIGGLAIALAAKESLENLFSSFTIFLDKPFVVGDLVKIGEIEGVIERVGFRSTRIRTLEKSFLTIPNKKMVDAELDNLSLRTFRRVKFFIGLTYGTKVETIKSIVHAIEEYLNNHELTNEEVHVRFKEFGPSSLNIMVLYFINTMDYATYLKYREEINFRIMEIVEEKGSEFAFPTQTLHLHQSKK